MTDRSVKPAVYDRPAMYDQPEDNALVFVFHRTSPARGAAIIAGGFAFEGEDPTDPAETLLSLERPLPPLPADEPAHAVAEFVILRLRVPAWVFTEWELGDFEMDFGIRASGPPASVVDDWGTLPEIADIKAFNVLLFRPGFRRFAHGGGLS